MSFEPDGRRTFQSLPVNEHGAVSSRDHGGNGGILIRSATPEDLQEVRFLFLEYAGSLGVSLDFQDFEAELAGLPGDYQPPGGCLLIATADGRIAGCVAMRKLTDLVCEMKRLYVRPGFRGLKIGRALTESTIAAAQASGYRSMRLDTLPSMKRARSLYADLGFREIPPYRHNPIPGTSYMELTWK